jgi:acylphosphatase
VRTVSEDVPFIVKGAITVRPDGNVTIVVTGPDTN